jgi:hypothetical protein
MKRYVFISVLLLIAFMWNCQTESSSPFTPEDLTTLATNSGDGTVTTAAKGGNDKGKGPKDKDATYSVEISFGTPVGIHTEAFMEPNWLTARNMNLDLSVLDALGECFTGGSYTGNLSLGQNINFFFKTNGVRYLLMMMDETGRTGDLPPGDNTPFTVWGGELWLEFHGGGGRKNACEGAVQQSWTIEVTKNESP